MMMFWVIFFCFVTLSMADKKYSCYSRAYYTRVCYHFEFTGSCQPWQLNKCEPVKITRDDYRCPHWFCVRVPLDFTVRVFQSFSSQKNYILSNLFKSFDPPVNRTLFRIRNRHKMSDRHLLNNHRASNLVPLNFRVRVFQSFSSQKNYFKQSL